MFHVTPDLREINLQEVGTTQIPADHINGMRFGWESRTPQFHGQSPWLVCEVALTNVVIHGFGVSRALGLKPSIKGRFTWVLGPSLLEAVGWEHGQSRGPDPAPRWTKNNKSISRHLLPKRPPLPTPMVMLAWSYNRGAHHIATTNHAPPPATYNLNSHAFPC